ncbi:hypothetical protein A4A49_32188 [Nicotiana attenuata]|uniref:Carboxypeptidase A inhibitor-like domain-containing protein n=1 Tax=Nicotiana attenuata TaxID=49451 RepID=A0A1J6KSF4_NICAT|nr:hypothetical protein A4A49_32188 [Nicotiana attenuata]
MANMMVHKLGFILTILLISAAVNVSWLERKCVIATPNVDHDLAAVKRRLLPQVNSLKTCTRACKTSADCSDCWFCCVCAQNAQGYPMCI